MASPLSTFNRFRHNLPMLAVVGSLVALVFYLLQSNFSSLSRSNDALRHRLAAETKQRGENLDVFFADRRSDLRTMAESAEIYGYLDSLAKGMSMTYGLGASKALIERLFSNYLQRTTAIESKGIYTRILLLDPKAETLVEVIHDTLGERGQMARSTSSGYALPRHGEIEFPTNHTDLLIGQACYYKSTNFAGQIVAGIIADRLANIIQAPSNATAASQTQMSALRLLGEDRFYPPTAIPERFRGEVVAQSDSRVDHGVLIGDRYLICSYQLKSQDAELVSIYDLWKLFGYHGVSGGMLVISMAILGGAILIVLLNTRSLVLKARLDESVVRHREIEEKHRPLELQIQERRKAEAALSRSEQNYREIFNATKDAIFLHRTEDGKVLDVNDAMLKMFGYAREEVCGLTLGRLSSERSPFGESDALEKIHKAQSEGAQVFEWQSRRKQGEWFWVEVSLRSSSIGGQGCVLAVVRDITERKRAQAEKEKLEVQLRQAQKMEAVGQLAGGVAHDFNNLLQVIHGNNEIVLAETPRNSSAHEPLNEIKLAAERAASLVRQLLSFSRRLPLVLEPVDLGVVIVDLGRMLRRLIGEHVELEIQVMKALHEVYADRSQIEQVFINLCVNSRDAMPDGGRITIRVENTRGCAPELNCPIEAPPLGYVCLTIRDTGVGIPPEILDRIFEPFFTTKDVGKGTGLGLSTVYSIMQRHEGHVHVQSQPARGTVFHVYFPAKAPAVAGREHPPAIQPIPKGQGEVVLVAEDEESVCQLAVRILQQAGYQVLVARDGDAALSLFLAHAGRIDLVMLDVVMPRKNGSAVFREIRTLSPGVPCLFTTGYSFGSSGQECLPEGVPVMQKPYLGEDLLRQVRAVLAQARPRAVPRVAAGDGVKTARSAA